MACSQPSLFRLDDGPNPLGAFKRILNHLSSHCGSAANKRCARRVSLFQRKTCPPILRELDAIRCLDLKLASEMQALFPCVTRRYHKTVFAQSRMWYVKRET